MAPQITLALSRDYDRTRPLVDGRVKVRGVDLIPMVLPSVEETFTRMGRNREFDVAEMSMSSYLVMRTRDNSPFVAIPVFPSKLFRHSCVYLAPESDIREPADLKGRVVGVPEWPMTAALWIRGILQDEYGVRIPDVRWRTGGMEQPGRVPVALGEMHFTLPEGTDIAAIPGDRTLSSMLRSSEIDALIAARIPSAFTEANARVRRLFPDYYEHERDYYRRTGIFPPMHVIVIRNDVYERYPWLAFNLTSAFEEAKRIAFEGLYDTSALLYGLPWLMPLLDEQRELFGADAWTYGLEPNRAALETMVRYSHEQGLSARRLTAEELFAPETLATVRV